MGEQQVGLLAETPGLLEGGTVRAREGRGARRPGSLESNRDRGQRLSQVSTYAGVR